MPLQKKSEKFKKSVDNYRPREYNIRVLATIAQLAEHLIRNERVVGSNPISGSNKIKASEKSEAFFFYFGNILWGDFYGSPFLFCIKTRRYD